MRKKHLQRHGLSKGIEIGQRNLNSLRLLFQPNEQIVFSLMSAYTVNILLP